MLRPYFPPLLPLDRSGRAAEWSRRESPWEALLSDARSKARLVSSRGGSDGLAAPTATVRPARAARTRISSRSPRFTHRHTFRAAINFLGTRCPTPLIGRPEGRPRPERVLKDAGARRPSGRTPQPRPGFSPCEQPSKPLNDLFQYRARGPDLPKAATPSTSRR